MTIKLRYQPFAEASKVSPENRNYPAETNYKKLKEIVKEKYASESEDVHLRRQLNQLRFLPSTGQTLSSFVERYHYLAKKLRRGDDKSILTDIIINLPIDVQGDLEYLTQTDALSSIEELNKVARRYDTISRKRTDLNDMGVKDSLLSIKEDLQQIKTIAFCPKETLAAVNAKEDQQGRKCYNCEEEGHFIKDCEKPKRQKLPTSSKEVTKPTGEKKSRWSKENEEARAKYIERFGPLKKCPICEGYHLIIHCPMKNALNL